MNRGLIDEVSGVPPTVEIEIRDYDVESEDRSGVKKDESGREYTSYLISPEAK